MYAMGLSAEEVERTTLAIDWNKGYQDKVGRDELSLRRSSRPRIPAAHRHRGQR
jgi:NTE family protein